MSEAAIPHPLLSGPQTFSGDVPSPVDTRSRSSGLIAAGDEDRQCE